MSKLTPELRKEYNELFEKCVITPSKKVLVLDAATKIKSNKTRYSNVSKETGVPWFVIGVIHNLESSLSFKCHLHNGDPLTQKTKHVPAGRPSGRPPFTWEFSAIDALKLRNMDEWNDWSVSGTLYCIETYNGWGYQKKNVPSPYLWSFSNNYSKGKYVADGKFDPNALSQQVGAGTVLHLLEWLKEIDLKE